MQRKGSILITILLVFAVVLMGALYMLSSSTLQSNILRNKTINNQSYYSAENKIYLVLYEDKYYKSQLLPIILEEFRKNTIYKKKEILIDLEDLEDGDSQKNVMTSFDIQNSRKCLKLVASSEDNNQITSVGSVYSIVKEILELGKPILHSDYLDYNYQEDLLNYFKAIERDASIDDLPRHIIGISTFDYVSITVNSIVNRHKQILFYRNNQLIKTEVYNNAVNNFYSIIMRDKYNKGINLNVNSPDYPTSMDGIIYIEGDLIISSEFIFNGIIIINGGSIIVNSEITPIINGIIISNGVEGWFDPDRLTINYNSKHIYDYGTYLPDFLEYKFVVMKKSK